MSDRKPQDRVAPSENASEPRPSLGHEPPDEAGTTLERGNEQRARFDDEGLEQDDEI